MKTLFQAVLLLNAVLLLSACPRIAHVSIYNNSGGAVRISVPGQESRLIAQGESFRFPFFEDHFTVSANGILWEYARNIPHSGENGPFFDGTLRVQLESDGSLHALKKEQVPPVLNFPEQPTGFPLKPKSPSRPPENNARDLT